MAAMRLAEDIETHLLRLGQDSGMPDRQVALHELSRSLQVPQKKLLRAGFDRLYRRLVEGT